MRRSPLSAGALVPPLPFRPLTPFGPSLLCWTFLSSRALGLPFLPRPLPRSSCFHSPHPAPARPCAPSALQAAAFILLTPQKSFDQETAHSGLLHL